MTSKIESMTRLLEKEVHKLVTSLNGVKDIIATQPSDVLVTYLFRDDLRQNAALLPVLKRLQEEWLYSVNFHKEKPEVPEQEVVHLFSMQAYRTLSALIQESRKDEQAKAAVGGLSALIDAIYAIGGVA